MADRKNKFAAGLAAMERPVSSDAEEPPPPPAATPAARGKGRPANGTGKRSNPDYRAATYYLRKDTLHAAQLRLMTLNDGRDLSDILQVQLEKWLESIAK